MSDIIIHHYPPSPVSEKVRVGLGVKGLSWHSVEQNRLPDRPELFALTGGYRRIPVMQIGADIYCDTQCILREMEARFPEPTFFPGGGKGMPYAVSRWTDGALFDQAVRLAFAPAVDALPEALVNDRARLYLGAQGSFKAEQAKLPHAAAQLRPQLGWVEQRLESGRSYILGDAPSLADVMVYYIVWFVHGRWDQADAFLSEFPNLLAWETRMKTIGHGTPSDMIPADALAVAAASEPTTPEAEDPRDPQGLKVGMNVSIVQDLDSGDPAVTGTVHALNRETISLRRTDPQAGNLCLHFPRVGYVVSAV